MWTDTMVSCYFHLPVILIGSEIKGKQSGGFKEFLYIL